MSANAAAVASSLRDHNESYARMASSRRRRDVYSLWLPVSQICSRTLAFPGVNLPKAALPGPCVTLSRGYCVSVLGNFLVLFSLNMPVKFMVMS